MERVAVDGRIERHVDRWWASFGVALFLLVPLDLFTTLLVVARHGPGVEANPVMRWLLQQGLVAAAAANLAVAAAAIVLFHAALDRLRRTPPAYHRSLVLLVNGWLAVLLLAGGALVTNNLLALV